jgi:alginate O-acetyltransferase complex protein AlgI
MIFNSNIFLLFFLPVVLVVYFLLRKNLKNPFLLIASLAFFSWGAPKFVFVVLFSVVVDFYLLNLTLSPGDKIRRLAFWMSVLLNLGLLVYFKYMNFFVDQFDALIGMLGKHPLSWTRIALPIGISFITFQKLSYTFDVYRKKQPPFASLFDYALYIFMFPQLLSGPIVRPGQIAGQIADRASSETVHDRLTGFIRFVIGLSKKVLIADTLGLTVNQIFALPDAGLSSGLAWAGAVAYSFQIYFDFSGYSDMAIGLGRMLGFRLPENFDSPYLSKSITEFWRRWHMTLSFWFRDYIFLPLAYALSRKMPQERYSGIRTDMILYILSTSITFLLCGFWHGAAWTFIAWGAFMGFFLILDRLFLLKWMKKTGPVAATLITFVFLTLGWVLFRSASLHQAGLIFHKLFAFQGGENEIVLNARFITMMVIAGVFSFWCFFRKTESWVVKLYEKPGNGIIIAMAIIAVVMLALDVATLTSSGFSPFIYFRF